MRNDLVSYKNLMLELTGTLGQLADCSHVRLRMSGLKSGSLCSRTDLEPWLCSPMARVVKVVWAATKNRWRGKKANATSVSTYTGTAA